jgi:hypothetical protein
MRPSWAYEWMCKHNRVLLAFVCLEEWTSGVSLFLLFILCSCSQPVGFPNKAQIKTHLRRWMCAKLQDPLITHTYQGQEWWSP